jgi:hypothetical protein
MEFLRSTGIKNCEHDCKEQDCEQDVRGATVRECHDITGCHAIGARDNKLKIASAS